MLLCLVIPASAQLEPWTLTEPEPWTKGAELEPKLETAAPVEPQPAKEPEPQSQPKQEAAAVESLPEPQTEPKSETAAAIEPSPKSEPESEPKSETASAIEPEPKPESEPKPEAAAAAADPEFIENFERKPEAAAVIEPQPAKKSEPKEKTAAAEPQELPRIAVYVTGDVPENEKRALGTRILASLINSKRYRGIERSNTLLAEIEKEQITQRSGSIDDNQISALGKRFGVRYICIADIIPAFGSFQISARIVDVETAEVVFIGEAFSSLKSADELIAVSDEVVRVMFRGQAASKPKPTVEKADKFAYGRMKVGARLAYTNSSVKNMEVWYQDYDKDLFQMTVPENYSHYPGRGHGFEIQAVVIYGLIDWLSLNFSPGLAFRNPFVSEVAKTREWALTVPVLLDYQILDLPLYLLGGVQFDVPFGSKVIWDNKGPEYEKRDFNRSSADFGVVLGVHLYLLEDYFIDFRYNIGLTGFKDYDGKKDSRMNQLSVGVGYDLTKYLMLPW